jgi:hypothetical protein
MYCYNAAAMSEERLVHWAQERGFELTPENRPVVARYLRRARLLPTLGALVGVLLPAVVELIWHGELVILGFHSDGSGAPYAGPFEAYIGYLLGALCAEVSLARPRDPARRSASLVRRDLDSYQPRRLRLAQRARWIVRRPQPFTSPSLVAADDAIRAQSVHALAGSGLALLLVALSGVFAVLTVSDVDLLNWTMWLPAVAAFVLSILACRDIGQQPWRVRRGIGRPAGAAPA